MAVDVRHPATLITELLLQRLGKTKTNKEFLAAIAKSMEEK